MPKSKDSYRKLVMDLAKAGTPEWIDMGLKVQTLTWQQSNEFIRRAKALRSASRKRGKR